MAKVKRNVKSKRVRENYTGKNSDGATVSRTNCRAASLATAGRSLELRPNTMTFTEMFPSPSSSPAAKSQRLYLSPTKLLSSATESPRGGAKTAAAKVEMTKPDTDHFGCGAAQIRNRWLNVMSVCAAVAPTSILTAR
jgi:hypothetical protein